MKNFLKSKLQAQKIYFSLYGLRRREAIFPYELVRNMKKRQFQVFKEAAAKNPLKPYRGWLCGHLLKELSTKNKDEGAGKTW